MGAVYQNSILTLAATWCEGNSQSLFSAPSDSQIISTYGPRPIFVRRRPLDYEQDYTVPQYWLLVSR